MARIDDYRNARELAVAHLKQQVFSELIDASGFTLDHEHAARIPFLDRVYCMGSVDFNFQDCRDETSEAPIQEQVLILHYLKGCPGEPVSGKWVAYREIPGAGFYTSAFVKRAIDPLKKVFGGQPGTLSGVGGELGGESITDGDVGLEFRILPHVPLKLILWEGDEEFPPEANIVFDASVGTLLSPEDIAWLAGMLVYRLIARSH